LAALKNVDTLASYVHSFSFSSKLKLKLKSSPINTEKYMRKPTPILAFLFLLVTASTFGQRDSLAPRNISVGPSPASMPKIISVSVISAKDDGQKTTFHLGDNIVVVVNNGETFENKVPRDSTPYLYINGITLRGITPVRHFFYKDEGGRSRQYVELIYKIDRENEASAKAMNEVYHSVKSTRKVPCTFAVGIPELWRTPNFTGNPGLSFSLIWNEKVAMLVVAFILLVLASAVLLAMKSGLLKDKTKFLEKNGEKMEIYSLAKSQLFFWSIIIISCYFALWGLTGSLPKLNSSTLILLCISMITTGGAKMIEVGQLGTGKNNDFMPKNFVADILSDARGINIHRFQMVLWTIGLGSYFIVSVIQNLAFPVFDDTLLALMGISNGTYLGLKIPEYQEDKKTEQQNQNASAQGAQTPLSDADKTKVDVAELRKAVDEIKNAMIAKAGGTSSGQAEG
jgi:hypothetical protein